MLTPRQNALEVIKGGNPDRFIKQYEPFYLSFMNDPLSASGQPMGPGLDWVNLWGVSYSWPDWAPGGMPIHTEETIVLKDINDWQEVIVPKAPDYNAFVDADYADYIAFAEQCDREAQWLTMGMAPGLFEQTCHFLGMENGLMTILTEPVKVKAMVEWLVDWEIGYAKTLIDRIHPDALFHHDDWGTQISTLISPDCFREIYLPAYKRLYGWYKDNGIELVVHHCDSWGASLVPMMIEMGVDIWQGCMSTNDLPSLVRQFGPQITFMGGIDNGIVDRVDWTPELVMREVRFQCENNGRLYFIPCTTHGLNFANYPGVYDEVDKCIEIMTSEMF
ncbi:MAG: hypothetical protein LBU61_00840 [Coriobacteriales bacterium]|jgi:hypothetical protein|nr:hypothetical protein [Coriobacteriales bacterium]